jgi:hypothetical protein
LVDAHSHERVLTANDTKRWGRPKFLLAMSPVITMHALQKLLDLTDGVLVLLNVFGGDAQVESLF